MKKRKYRITFHGPGGEPSESVDVNASSDDEAFSIAYGMPQAKDRRYTDVSVVEFPDGISNIGIHFEYYDSALRQTFSDCLIIRAGSEKDAVNYYNSHFYGKHFWFNAGKIENDGKCTYGRIKNTYFAACPGWNADATKDS